MHGQNLRKPLLRGHTNRELELVVDDSERQLVQEIRRKPDLGLVQAESEKTDVPNRSTLTESSPTSRYLISPETLFLRPNERHLGEIVDPGRRTTHFRLLTSVAVDHSPFLAGCQQVTGFLFVPCFRCLRPFRTNTSLTSPGRRPRIMAPLPIHDCHLHSTQGLVVGR